MSCKSDSLMRPGTVFHYSECTDDNTEKVTWRCSVILWTRRDVLLTGKTKRCVLLRFCVIMTEFVAGEHGFA